MLVEGTGQFNMLDGTGQFNMLVEGTGQFNMLLEGTGQINKAPNKGHLTLFRLPSALHCSRKENA